MTGPLLHARTLASRLWGRFLPTQPEEPEPDPRAFSPSQARVLGEDLLAEKQSLIDFTLAMEQEFLDLGALLRSIASLARQVRDRSGDIMSAASGQSEDAAIQFAFQLLKKAEDVVAASREQHANVFSVFAKIQAGLALLIHERHLLMRTLAPLEPTNTQYRIQATSFDQDTRSRFFALAESIGAIVRDTQSAVGQRFDELERMGKSTAELTSRLAAMSGAQKVETDVLLCQTRQNLAELNVALLAAGDESQALGELGSRIAAGVGKAIVGLQCQDIARQKFEHINSAIDEMEARLNADSSSAVSAFLAAAARLQISQLYAVFDQLDGAATGLETGLREVQSDAAILAESSARTGSKILDGTVVSRAVASIHGVLSVIDKAIAGIDSTRSIVHSLKLSFTDCTSEILSLAHRLRMTALNAQIFAAHVDRGVALEVVAQNTRTVADSAMDKLDLISHHVDELVDLVLDLEQQIADYRDLASSERDLLSAEAGESEARLAILDAGLSEAISAIGPLETQLSESVAQAVARIRFPQAVTAARARSTALFEGILTRHAGSPEEQSAIAELEALKENYTMEHERRIHDAALGSTVGTNEADPHHEIDLFEGGNDEPIADNIELF